MGALPGDFQFSQANLQDYVDCPRRFQLRFLHRLAWPAVQTEPVLENERLMQQGQRFHRLVYQRLVGIPAGRLSQTIRDPQLEEWWQSFLEFYEAPSRLSGQAYPEVSLSACLGRHALTARCDLVIRHPDGVLQIFDWKTSRKRPQRQWLANRLQTRVYPYVLVCAGRHLNQGLPVLPERVEMVYWFTEFPTQPESFCYDLEQYRADEAYLLALESEIDPLTGDGYPLTPRSEQDRFCVYRSLCDRGRRAGSLEDGADSLDAPAETSLAFDFDQIPEIAF